MKTIESFLNVDGSGDYISQFDATISSLNANIISYQNSADSYEGAFNNWGRVAQEDAEKVFRNLTYPEFSSQCFKASKPCYNKGKSGRGDRYNDRYSKAMGYWTQWQTRKNAVAEFKSQLATAIQAKEDAESAVNNAIEQGTSPAQAEAIAQAELDRIKAETDAALAQAQKDIENANLKKSEAESNPNTKYYLIGAALLVGVTAFILIKKMK